MQVNQQILVKFGKKVYNNNEIPLAFLAILNSNNIESKGHIAEGWVCFKYNVTMR